MMSAGIFSTFGAIMTVVSVGVLSVSAASADQPGDLVARGKYLATMGDCQACHTAPGGTPFVGGLEMDTPFGKIPTPNITPDKTTGIGNYTDAQFIRVFHAGIRRDGAYLYPVMPFPWYAKVTDADILAIKAYLFSLPPVNAPRKPLQSPFPSISAPAWPCGTRCFSSPACSSRTRRNPRRSIVAPTSSRGSNIAANATTSGTSWVPARLRSRCRAVRSIIGTRPTSPRTCAPASAALPMTSCSPILKTGTAPGVGTVVGPMAQTQHESLSKLTDDDLHAIVAYLKSTPARAGYRPVRPAGLVNAALPGTGLISTTALPATSSTGQVSPMRSHRWSATAW